MAVSSWFVEVTRFKDRMVELNQEITWVPEHVKDGQFGKWLENARDWSISRNRFWGSPIPVWKSDDPQYPRIDVYGSFEELERDFGRLPLNEKTVGAMTNMIRYSSNEDATRVLRWVGIDRLAEILQSSRFALYDRAGAGGLWVGKSYGPEAAVRRDPLKNLSHGATVYQTARLYWMLATDQLLSAPMNTLMKQVLSKPGIQHKFVKGLGGRPGVEIFRKSGTWKNTHADSALVECQGRRYVLVGIAEHPDGGDWLARVAGPLHDLIVAPEVSIVAGTSHAARLTH